MAVYAIAAHANPKKLDALLEILNGRNVYLHLDKSVKRQNFLKELGNLHNPGLKVLEESESIRVNWCGFSQLKLQFKFIEKYLQDTDSFGPLVLLSGECYPIKKLVEFEEFLQTKNDFISVFKIPELQSQSANPVDQHRINKITRIYLQDLRFLKKIKKRGSLVYKIASFPSKLIRTMKIPNLRIDTSAEFYEGSDWIAIGKDLAKDLITHKDEILKEFRYCFCPSEIAIQSYFGRLNTTEEENEFESKSQIVSTNSAAEHAPFHYIHPSLNYSWELKDLEQIISSEKYFIRKPDLRLIGYLRDKIINL